MAVHNVMEGVIKGIVAEHLDRLHLSCKCEKCREVILALSLNKVRPKYIVKDS
ncbi:late competence development ComFB family protein [Pseudobacillus sp. FSL P4-0506]|uniref:late competence development ComFB family protein n=1 Tax=unclassified Pseudobacillus TaxID=2619284 RepID=UPI0030FBD200